MNSILQLKGRFEHKKGNAGGGKRNLPANSNVSVEHIDELIEEMQSLQMYWTKHTLIKGALVSVYYINVIAKSNRIRCLLCKGSRDPNESIRGAKFFKNGNSIQHVFTYYISLEDIACTIDKLQAAKEIIAETYGGNITNLDIAVINSGQNRYEYDDKISKTTFINVVADAYYVQKFTVDFAEKEEIEDSIVTLYKTDVATEDLFKAIGIDFLNARKIDDTTILMRPDEIELLRNAAPYIIAMKVRDLREVVLEESIDCNLGDNLIQEPHQEPIIGVIDTPFSEKVYFRDWVTYESMLDENIPLNYNDYDHGTAVSSIIVDGPTINPSLDDGCGRFRVKHFGVATSGRFSSYSVLKSIRKAVSKNRNIKVWNLSLGSSLPIKQNFISPEAAELDKIQNEFDVIFVIAGTNNSDINKKNLPIGAPADSLNSLVVNSVTSKNNPALYHRVGPVLSFFHKPDVSYFGGDEDEPMRVCTSTGEGLVQGTSFAAPWITRKMAYLIYKLGFTREVAKALIIDAAAGWERMDDASCAIGFGVVPQNIQDIVKTKDDEIKFVLTGTTDEYETYTYNIPIPIYKEKQPFYARATLCYFPKCLRNQGVDYTTTEMDIHFGRTEIKNGKAIIHSINANTQSDENGIPMVEPEARSLYRKWDNVKLISDRLMGRSVPRKVYGAGMWGLSIKTKERLKEKNGKGLSFGIVITLKEMNGENRIDDFIKLCQVRSWIVNKIEVDNQLNIYNKAEEEIEF